MWNNLIYKNYNNHAFNIIGGTFLNFSQSPYIINGIYVNLFSNNTGYLVICSLYNMVRYRTKITFQNSSWSFSRHDFAL